MTEETQELENLESTPVVTKDLVVKTVAQTLVAAVTMAVANVAIGRFQKFVEDRRATKSEDPS